MPAVALFIALEGFVNGFAPKGNRMNSPFSRFRTQHGVTRKTFFYSLCGTRSFLRGCLSAATLVFCPAVYAQGNHQVDSVTQEVRGGTEINGFTGIVELSVGCTGSLIGPDLVLTAAHCFGISGVKFSGSRAITVLYFDPQAGRRVVYSGMASWFAHPDYNGSLSGPGAANADIAVIRIPDAFTETDHEDYLRLYADSAERLRFTETDPEVYPRLRTRLIAYGAGIYTYSGKRDDKLRFAWFDVENVEKHHIVIDTRKKVGICKGDSGGPLVYQVPGRKESIPLVAGVSARIEFFGDEPEVCTNNDWGIDDAFSSRTNWEKLETVMNSAGVTCSLQQVGGVYYRRCFSIPIIESIDYEGLDRGTGTAIVIAAIN